MAAAPDAAEELSPKMESVRPTFGGFSSSLFLSCDFMKGLSLAPILAAGDGASVQVFSFYRVGLSRENGRYRWMLSFPGHLNPQITTIAVA